MFSEFPDLRFRFLLMENLRKKLHFIDFQQLMLGKIRLPFIKWFLRIASTTEKGLIWNLKPCLCFNQIIESKQYQKGLKHVFEHFAKKLTFFSTLILKSSCYLSNKVSVRRLKGTVKFWKSSQISDISSVLYDIAPIQFLCVISLIIL